MDQLPYPALQSIVNHLEPYDWPFLRLVSSIDIFVRKKDLHTPLVSDIKGKGSNFLKLLKTGFKELESGCRLPNHKA